MTTIERTRAPKILRRHSARSQAQVTPLEVERALDGILRVDLPGGGAVLLQRLPPTKAAPGGTFAAALVEDYELAKKQRERREEIERANAQDAALDYMAGITANVGGTLRRREREMQSA